LSNFRSVRENSYPQSSTNDCSDISIRNVSDKFEENNNQNAKESEDIYNMNFNFESETISNVPNMRESKSCSQSPTNYYSAESVEVIGKSEDYENKNATEDIIQMNFNVVSHSLSNVSVVESNNLPSSSTNDCCDNSMINESAKVEESLKKIGSFINPHEATEQDKTSDDCNLVESAPVIYNACNDKKNNGGEEIAYCSSENMENSCDANDSPKDSEDDLDLRLETISNDSTEQDKLSDDCNLEELSHDTNNDCNDESSKESKELAKCVSKEIDNSRNTDETAKDSEDLNFESKTTSIVSTEQEKLIDDRNLVEVNISVLSLSGLKKSESQTNSNVDLTNSDNSDDLISSFVRFSFKPKDKPTYITRIPSNLFMTPTITPLTVLWPFDNHGLPSYSMKFSTSMKEKDDIRMLSDEIEIFVGISMRKQHAFLGATKLSLRGRTKQKTISLPVSHIQNSNDSRNNIANLFSLNDDAKLDVLLQVKQKEPSYAGVNSLIEMMTSSRETDSTNEICEIGFLNEEMFTFSNENNFLLEDDDTIDLYRSKVPDEDSVATPSGPLFYHVDSSQDDEDIDNRYLPKSNSKFLVEYTTDCFDPQSTISSVDSRVSLISLPYSLPFSHSFDNNFDEQDESHLPQPVERILQKMSCHQCDNEFFEHDDSFSDSSWSTNGSYDLNDLANVIVACDSSIDSISAKSFLKAKRKIEQYADRKGIAVQVVWNNV